jgi:hypothetical protein
MERPDCRVLAGAETEARVRRDRLVEAPRRIEVADADPKVVDAAVGHGGLGFAVERLDTVAVRVEKEAAVVVRVVTRPRPRRSVTAIARLDPGAPEGVDGRAVGSTEAHMKPPGHRMLAIGREKVPVLPLDQFTVGAHRFRAVHRKHGAVEAAGSAQI